MIIKNVIISIDDLVIERSKELVKEFNLDISQIPKDFLEIFLIKKSKKSGIKLTKESPLNIYNIYSKKFASSAVINYELSKRKSIWFVKDEGLFKITGSENFNYYFLEAQRDDMTSCSLIKSQLDYYNSL
ncbi:hypothetical protein GW931_01235 [archaeon]|nr:hypothetical protein [archaeon]PJC45444.1 MAG: hypothetical protein CO037_01445 [Candidatus Pacearchaeota archaeon CG_4_9_14_0_2_um_filter_30_8]